MTEPTPNIVALREIVSQRIHDLARILRHRDMLKGTEAVAEASRIERALVVLHETRAAWILQPEDADALIRLVHDAAENLAYVQDRAGEEETQKLLRWLDAKKTPPDASSRTGQPITGRSNAQSS